MIEIEAPDGTVVEFPDGTPPEEMQRAMRAQFGGPETVQGQSYASGMLDAVTRGITMGGGDELTAAEAALLGRTPEGGWFDYSAPFSERYNRALEAERGQQARFTEENPVSSIAGDIGGGLLTAGGAARQGLTLANRAASGSRLAQLGQRAGRAAVEGAGYGAAAGAGYAEGGLGNRLKGAGTGAVLGAGVGGALPVVGAGARAVASPVTRAIARRVNPTGTQQQAGIDLVERIGQRAGLTADDMMEGVRQGRVVAQQDPELTRLTRSIKQQPTGARGVINQALDSGYQDRQAIARGAVEGGLDAEPNFYRWLDNFKRQNAAASQTAYSKSFADNWGSKGPPFKLDELMQSGRIPASALREAQQLAQIEGRPFGQNLIASIDDATGQVTFGRLPSLQEAEIIRRGLKAATTQAYRGGSATGPALRGLERELRTILDDASPALRKTRANYATSAQIQEAADLGQRLSRMAADEVEFLVDDMSRAEIEALRKSYAASLKNQIERGALNRDAVRNIFGTERQRRVLQKLWPNQKEFDQFRTGMENIAEYNAMRQNVQGGSPTAENLFAASDLNSGGVVNAGQRLLRGDVVGGMVDLVMPIIGRRLNPARGLPEEQLRRAAQILTEQNPAEVRRLMTQVQQNDPNAVRRLTGRLLLLVGNAAPSAPVPRAALSAQTGGAFAPTELTITPSDIPR